MNISRLSALCAFALLACLPAMGINTDLEKQLEKLNSSNPKLAQKYWDEINTNDLAFPEDFLFGLGTSAYQVEQDCNNNTWSNFWQGHTDQDGSDFVPAGNACEHWTRYKQDLRLLKATGANTYRFSLEWSKIMPSPGVIDEAALRHYEEMCQEMMRLGIKPVITMHHYTDPVWFMKLGGFADENNIQHYVKYCEIIFDRLHPYVHLWLTFNSPSGYALPGYFSGTKPPAKKNMQLAIEVLKNILEAHVQVYHSLKKRPGGQDARIGITKNIFHIDPWNVYNPLDWLKASVAKKLVDTCIYDFFTTGTFNVSIPFKVSVKHTNKLAAESLDFIALNYYSHNYVSATWMGPDPDGVTTDTDRYTIYAEGLYRAIKELSHNVAFKLAIPIYVTENGIGTSDDDKRELHNRRYLWILSQAVNNGYPVKGYIHWSLMDNYEWGTYRPRFGVYHVDFTTQARTLKEGAHHLVNVYQTFTA